MEDDCSIPSSLPESFGDKDLQDPAFVEELFSSFADERASVNFENRNYTKESTLNDGSNEVLESRADASNAESSNDDFYIAETASSDDSACEADATEADDFMVDNELNIEWALEVYDRYWLLLHERMPEVLLGIPRELHLATEPQFARGLNVLLNAAHDNDGIPLNMDTKDKLLMSLMHFYYRGGADLLERNLSQHLVDFVHMTATPASLDTPAPLVDVVADDDAVNEPAAPVSDDVRMSYRTQ
eukprot:TRINITY_DN11468_c0_g1_i1.p2 TRINITY_DN11468_c0_g1~~TRINITY_DN11468_c0_g1_i1.p2  ORF type:complete len:255 (-),score=51.19 TRINITY_DN11468_c0_g1_i1:1162-1893(-)